MRTFGFGKRLEPVRNFVEVFITRCLGHTRVHIGVFMGFAGDSGGQISGRSADRQTCCRITDLFEVLEMTVRMARFTFGG